MTNGPDGADLLDIYRKAALIQKNDEQFHSMIRRGKLVCPYYSARGQEIIPSAISSHLTNDDYIVTIYRGMHDQIAKGVPLRLLWAEYAGKVSGACKGKGGPMHITHPETGVMVTTGIVGGGIPIANGLALASDVRGDGRVTVCNFGDGASNIGAFHESLNMASVWKLPVIFVCQNNGYAEHTRYAAATSVERVADRAAGYGMPGITVDGNDPSAMWRVAKEAVDRARSGEGPTLIEAITFRFSGHFYGDDGAYIPAEEMAAAKERDPLPRLRADLLAQGIASEGDLAAIEAEMDAAIEDAISFALAGEVPEPTEILRDVYGEEISA